MKRYSILHPLWLSFFSKDLYQDVAKNWKGTGFLYLLMLLAICWIPTMVKLQVGLSGFVAKDARRFINQMPNITIHNGEVSIDEASPHYIENPDSHRVEAIVDTSGQITSLEGTKAVALLTKTKMIVRENAVQTRAYDLSQIKDFVLTRERASSWLSIIKHWFMIVVLPICVFGSYIYRIVQALIYAAIGLIFASVLKTSLDYLALVRLSVVAVTPAIVLDTLFSLVDVRMTAWGLICLIIAMVYLYMGIKANSPVISQPLSTEPPPTSVS